MNSIGPDLGKFLGTNAILKSWILKKNSLMESIFLPEDQVVQGYGISPQRNYSEPRNTRVN